MKTAFVHLGRLLLGGFVISLVVVPVVLDEKWARFLLCILASGLLTVIAWATGYVILDTMPVRRLKLRVTGAWYRWRTKNFRFR